MTNEPLNPSAQPSKETDMQPINEFDQNRFYEKDHVDENAFSEENRSSEDLVYQEISGTASISDRLADEASAQEVEHKAPPRPEDKPTEADGETLLNVGRAPDS